MNTIQLPMNRRQFVKSITTLFAAAGLFPQFLSANQASLIKKPIPSSGELLPVIGMGSARTFDVGKDLEKRAVLLQVLQTFFDRGGSLIDTSPMYGSSEEVIGDLLKKIGNKEHFFFATKVWTHGEKEGIKQMNQSMQRMGVNVIDLMQIHNLIDWQTHLKTLKEWKDQGKVRYIGITTSHGRNHEAMETILNQESFDFVQFSYNIADRTAEKRLLPLAKDQGIATLINRPYQRGELFNIVKGKPLPKWAADFDCESWGQFFLKFIVSHPDVTCVIPATSKVSHMTDNMGAGFGALPDSKTRQKMIAYFESL